MIVVDTGVLYAAADSRDHDHEACVALLDARPSAELIVPAPGVWKPATIKAGLDGLIFHDLRRANATGLVADGVDVKTAQPRLGHSDPRLTLAIYAQATGEADRSAAARIGARFLPPKGPASGSSSGNPGAWSTPGA